MSKIEVNAVAEVLKRNSVPPPMLRVILEELQILTQADDAEETAPPVKKQFCIIVSDPEGMLPRHDFVGWVVQIPESESPATTQERIFRSAYEFNVTKKGRLLPVKTVGEALENVPAKICKEAELWVKTKTPVLVLRTDNAIPTEDREE